MLQLNNDIMITPRQLQGFINWQQEKPEARKVEIKIGDNGYRKIEIEPGKFDYAQYRVCVSENDNTYGFACQFVYDVSEINLNNQRKIDLQRKIEQLQKLEQQMEVEEYGISNQV